VNADERVRARINKHVSSATFLPGQLVTVRDAPKSVVMKVIQEFRSKGWIISDPFSTLDGDFVITVKEHNGA
jgi:hypothetical protein